MIIVFSIFTLVTIENNIFQGWREGSVDRVLHKHEELSSDSLHPHVESEVWKPQLCERGERRTLRIIGLPD